MFHSYFERKNDKVFNIVHFPNFEISAIPHSFNIYLAPGALIRGNTVVVLTSKQVQFLHG